MKTYGDNIKLIFHFFVNFTTAVVLKAVAMVSKVAGIRTGALLWYARLLMLPVSSNHFTVLRIVDLFGVFSTIGNLFWTVSKDLVSKWRWTMKWKPFWDNIKLILQFFVYFTAQWPIVKLRTDLFLHMMRRGWDNTLWQFRARGACL